MTDGATPKRFSLFAVLALVTFLCVSLALLRIGGPFILLGMLMLGTILGGVVGRFFVREDGFFTGAVWGLSLMFVLPPLLIILWGSLW